MTKITQEDIRMINLLYYKYKVYARVARELNISASTVKKYVIPNFSPIEETTIKRFEGNLPEFDPVIFRNNKWSDLCVLSEKEIEEVKDLWNEMEI